MERFTIPSAPGQLAIQLDGTVDSGTSNGSMLTGGQAVGTWVATRAKDAPSASSPSLIGTWNVTIELPNMTANPTMILKQEGEKVTGEYVSAQYGKFPMTGTLKGSDVVMSFQMNVEDNSLNVTYSGKVEKD